MRNVSRRLLSVFIVFVVIFKFNFHQLFWHERVYFLVVSGTVLYFDIHTCWKLELYSVLSVFASRME